MVLRRPLDIGSISAMLSLDKFDVLHCMKRISIYHLNNGGEQATLVQDLNTFMKTHFLQWLEVMSLLGLVSDAVPMLRIIENQIKVSIHFLTKYGY